MTDVNPLDPFDPHRGDEHTVEHTDETSFGGRGNNGFDPDYYTSVDARNDAKIAINMLSKEGLQTPSDLFYSIVKRDSGFNPMVSIDNMSFYKVIKSGSDTFAVLDAQGNKAPDLFYEKLGIGDRPKEKVVEDLRDRERRQEESGNFIKSLFVNPDFTKFKHGINDLGRTFVKLMRIDAVEYVVNQDGTLSKGQNRNKPPESLLVALGIRKVDEIAENKAKITENEEKIRQEREKTTTFLNKTYEPDDESEEEEVTAAQARSLFGTSTKDFKRLEEFELKTQEEIQGEIDETRPLLAKSSDTSTISKLRDKVGRLKSRLTRSSQRYSKLREEYPYVLEREEEVTRLEDENEEIEERNEEITETLPLKERVKEIFKKHGVTVVGVLAAVGTVIGVIVSNLKVGLGKVATGVENGLKEIGKKLGQILPGMVGAIVSFLFKAAGSAIGFLAKNSWLLILLVVTFAIDQFKAKKGSEQ